MIFPCIKIVTPNNVKSFVYYPYLKVILSNTKDNSQSISIEGLVDSGADISVINCVYAKSLGIDYKTGIVGQSSGVYGGRKDIYYHQVNLEIVGMVDSKLRILLGFMESSNTPFLIGRKDFFDNFKVTFDMFNYSFEIESYKSIFASKS